MKINESKYIPIGTVEVEEVETGKIVYKTHNMIVESGREMILKILFPEDSRSNLTYGPLTKFYEKNHRNLTVPEMQIQSVASGQSIDPSLICRRDDIILDGDSDINLSEIVLSTKTYEIGDKTDRKLYLRADGEDDQLININENEDIYEGTYNPNTVTGQEPLTDGESLVLKFEDGAQDLLHAFNQVIHICCANPLTTDAKAITAVGLAFDDNGTLKLFSRAAIDPIFMRPGRHYIMHYTLHF